MRHVLLLGALAGALIGVLGCSESAPPARIERIGLQVPFTDSLRTALDAYFRSHRAPSRPTALMNDHWKRAVILRKVRTLTTELNVLLLVYTEGEGLRTLESGLASGPCVDLKSDVGSEVWFDDSADDRIYGTEIMPIREGILIVGRPTRAP